MRISFRNSKLEKCFNDDAQLCRHYGDECAGKIRIRMKELRAAVSLKDFWPPKSPPSRCHELDKGQRRNQLSVDVSFPKRIIFVPDHDPVPKLPDGGLDWAGVTAIRITGVEDTHG